MITRQWKCWTCETPHPWPEDLDTMRNYKCRCGGDVGLTVMGSFGDMGDNANDMLDMLRVAVENIDSDLTMDELMQLEEAGKSTKQ